MRKELARLVKKFASDVDTIFQAFYALEIEYAAQLDKSINLLNMSEDEFIIPEKFTASTNKYFFIQDNKNDSLRNAGERHESENFVASLHKLLENKKSEVKLCYVMDRFNAYLGLFGDQLYGMLNTVLIKSEMVDLKDVFYESIKKDGALYEIINNLRNLLKEKVEDKRLNLLICLLIDVIQSFRVKAHYIVNNKAIANKNNSKDTAAAVLSEAQKRFIPNYSLVIDAAEKNSDFANYHVKLNILAGEINNFIKGLDRLIARLEKKSKDEITTAKIEQLQFFKKNFVSLKEFSLDGKDFKNLYTEIAKNYKSKVADLKKEHAFDKHTSQGFKGAFFKQFNVRTDTRKSLNTLIVDTQENIVKKERRIKRLTLKR